MARTIRIGEIGDYTGGQFHKLITAAVLEADARLKSGSPVDTGRFRASWAIGENAAPYEGHGPVPKGEKISAPPPNAINYTIGNEKVGNVYSVHNNLIYAESLAIKGSRKFGVDPGWVDSIAKDVQTYVDAEANRIGRNS